MILLLFWSIVLLYLVGFVTLFPSRRILLQKDFSLFSSAKYKRIKQQTSSSPSVRVEDIIPIENSNNYSRPVKVNYKASINRLEGLQGVLNEVLLSKQKRFTDRSSQIQSVIQFCQRLYASGIYDQILLLFHLFLNNDNFYQTTTAAAPSQQQSTSTGTSDRLKGIGAHRYALFSDRLDRLSSKLTSSPEFLIILIRSFIAMSDIDTAIQLLQLYSAKGVLFSSESKSLLICELSKSSIIGMQAALKIRRSMIQQKQPLSIQASISLLKGIYKFGMENISLSQEETADRESIERSDELMVNPSLLRADRFSKMRKQTKLVEPSGLEMTPLSMIELANEIFQSFFPQTNVTNTTQSAVDYRQKQSDKKQKQELTQEFVRILFRYSVYSVITSSDDYQAQYNPNSEQRKTLQLMKEASLYSDIDPTFLDEVELLTNQMKQRQSNREEESPEMLREEGVVRGIAVTFSFLHQMNYTMDLKMMEILIQECMKENELLGVKYLFAMMQKHKIFSRTKTFHLLLKAYRSLSRRQLLPTVSSASPQNSNDVGSATVGFYQAYSLMKSVMQSTNHTKPNIQTYEILLHLYHNAIRQVEKGQSNQQITPLGQALIEELRVHHQYANSFYWTKEIFHSLLHICIATADPNSDATACYGRILQEMIASNVQPDYSTMKIIYDGLAAKNDSKLLIELYALQMKGELSRRKVIGSYLEAVRMRFLSVLPEDQKIFEYLSREDSVEKQMYLYLPSLTVDGVTVIAKHLITMNHFTEAFDVFQHYLKCANEQMLPMVPFADSLSIMDTETTASVETNAISGFEKYSLQPSSEIFTIMLEGLIAERGKQPITAVKEIKKYDDQIELVRKQLQDWAVIPSRQWYHLLMMYLGTKHTSLTPAIQILQEMKHHYVPSYETLKCLFSIYQIVREKFSKALLLSSMKTTADQLPSSAATIAKVAESYLMNQLRELANCLKSLDEDIRYDLSAYSQEYLFQVYSDGYLIGKLLEQMDDIAFNSTFGPDGMKSSSASSSPSSFSSKEVIIVSMNVINTLLKGLQLLDPNLSSLSKSQQMQQLKGRKKEIANLLFDFGRCGIIPDDEVFEYFDTSDLPEDEGDESENENDQNTVAEGVSGSFYKEYRAFQEDFLQKVELKEFGERAITSATPTENVANNTSDLQGNSPSLREEEDEEEEKRAELASSKTMKEKMTELDPFKDYVRLFHQSIYRHHPRPHFIKQDQVTNHSFIVPTTPEASPPSKEEENRNFYDEYQLIIDEEKDLFQDILFNHSSYFTATSTSSSNALFSYEPEKEKQIVFREAVKTMEKRFRQIETTMQSSSSSSKKQSLKPIFHYLLKDQNQERIIPFLSEMRQRFILQTKDKKGKYKSWKQYRQAAADRQFVLSSSSSPSPPPPPPPSSSSSSLPIRERVNIAAPVTEKEKEEKKGNMKSRIRSTSPILDEEIKLSSKRSWNKKYFQSKK